MASRSKGKGKGSSSSSSAYFPTQWSQWDWNAQEGREMRYRLAGPDDYEYDYKDAAPTDPRTQSATSHLPTGAQQPYTTSANYTHTTASSVSALTQGIAGVALGPNLPGATLGTAPALQEAPLVLPQGITGHIRTRNYHTTAETFDPHYKVHGAWEFKQFKVFKVLWAEPNGVGVDENASGTLSVRDVQVGNYNEKISHKVRRFVIIKADHGFCLCLPISTYTYKGTTKKGIRAETHTAIYTESKPTILDGERQKGMSMKPIKVKAPTRHKLDKTSRLNYAKLYTVEYNVKIWFIGTVDDGSQWQLITDYNRMHPPLVPPDISTSTTEDTFDYAQGGSSSSTYRYPLPATTSQHGTQQPAVSSYHGTSNYGPGGHTILPTDPFYGHQQQPGTAARSASAPPPAVVYSSSPPGGYPAAASQSAYGPVHTSPQYQYGSMNPQSTASTGHHAAFPASTGHHAAFPAATGHQSTAYPANTSPTGFASSSVPAHATQNYPSAAAYGSSPTYPSAVPAAHSYDPTIPTQYPASSPGVDHHPEPQQYQAPSARPVPQHSSSYPDDRSAKSGSKKKGSSGKK